MENQEAQNEIQFIKKIINDSRQEFADNGLGLIVWGVLIVLGIAVHTLLYYWHVRFQAVILWGSVIGIGWIYSIASGIRERSRHRCDTFAGKMIRSIWIACGISLGVLGFCGYTHIDFRLVPGLFCLVMAIGMFLLGQAVGRLAVTLTSCGWWLGGGAMLLFPSVWSLLYFGVLMIILGIVPGISLYLRWRKEFPRQRS